MSSVRTLQNYIGGAWTASEGTRQLDVGDPASGELLARVPLSSPDEAAGAVAAAKEAFATWREIPPYTRAGYLFRLRDRMERFAEDLARSVVCEHGKIIDEARGEIRRAIENVEVAAGVPTLMMGMNMENVAAGIDEVCLPQPLGVFAGVAPFNFPAMVPYWFLPYAIACGNTYVLKPSERCPLTQTMLFGLLDDIGLPPGVANLLHGDRTVVDALLEHPDVRGISFVGSTPVGRYLYAKGSAAGKRMQCQAGAKNCLVVMPDAVLEETVPAILASAFGSSGQRCLAGSLLIAVGEVHEPLMEALVGGARQIRLGHGLDESSGMGPVVSAESKARVLRLIGEGVAEGATLLLDGREAAVAGYPQGHWVGPTILADVTPEMAVAREEIFGPVLGVMRASDLEEALALVNGSAYGNAASIFTQSGRWAREFAHHATVGNVGVNVGVAAPMASFPFSGTKESFFGDLHGQGHDAIRFFTERKVVISRWF